MIPKDPMMLLSFVNTQLRDTYASLDDFCSAFGAAKTAIEEKLESIDYAYDASLNRFV